MTIPSRGTPEFWRLYHLLPTEVRATARKNYRLWQANAFPPSRHFKRIGSSNWSARVGEGYRAMGKFVGSEFLWT